MKLFLIASALTFVAGVPAHARENSALTELVTAAGAPSLNAVPAPETPKIVSKKPEPGAVIVDCALGANSDMHVRLKTVDGIAKEAAFDNWDWSLSGPFHILTPSPTKTPASEALYDWKEGMVITHSFRVSLAALKGNGTLVVDGMPYHCP